MTKTPAITNVHVAPPDHGTQAFAGFTFGDARYHIWIDVNTRLFVGAPMLYKNPIVKRGEPGWFKTRHLDPMASDNARMLHAMWRQIEAGDLINRAIAVARERDGQRDAACKAEALAERKRRAGPALFDTVARLLAAFDRIEANAIGDTTRMHIDNARRLLGGIEVGTAFTEPD